jgi:hypothetical protein
MMRKLLASAAVLAVCSLPANALSSRDFLDLCHSSEKWRQVACMSYAAGVIDSFYALGATTMTPTTREMSLGGICLPKDAKIDGSDIVRFTESFQHEWPEAAELDAAMNALAGLRTRYPCKK